MLEAGGVYEIIDGIARSGHRLQHHRLRRERVIMFDGDNLVAGHIHVAGLRAAIQVEAGNGSQGLTALMANGEAVLQHSEISRQRRQCRQQQENAGHEFFMQTQI